MHAQIGWNVNIFIIFNTNADENFSFNIFVWINFTLHDSFECSPFTIFTQIKICFKNPPKMRLFKVTLKKWIVNEKIIL